MGPLLRPDGKRPNKSQRQLYQKYLTKVTAQVEAAPMVDVRPLRLPPFIAGNPELLARFERRIELVQKAALAASKQPDKSPCLSPHPALDTDAQAMADEGKARAQGQQDLSSSPCGLNP